MDNRIPTEDVEELANMASSPNVKEESTQSNEHTPAPDNAAVVDEDNESVLSSIPNSPAPAVVPASDAATSTPVRPTNDATEASSKKRKAGAMMEDDDDDEQSQTLAIRKKAAKTTRVSKRGKKVTPSKPTEESDEEPRSDDGPKHGKKKRCRRAPEKKVAANRGIPRTLAEAEEADRMLLDWRAAGKSWKEIREEWLRITGDEIAASTLPNRWGRVLENCTMLKEEDRVKLILAKRQVEADFEKVKWSRIAQDVKKRGGDTYNSDILQRMYKTMMKKEGIRGPSEKQKAAGVVDRDFDVESLPDTSIEADVGGE